MGRRLRRFQCAAASTGAEHAPLSGTPTAFPAAPTLAGAGVGVQEQRGPPTGSGSPPPSEPPLSALHCPPTAVAPSLLSASSVPSPPALPDAWLPMPGTGISEGEGVVDGDAQFIHYVCAWLVPHCCALPVGQAFILTFNVLVPPPHHPWTQRLPATLPGPGAGVDELTAFAREWHVQHYQMDADLATRDANPSIQHLSFLYGVREQLGAVCMHAW